MTIREDIREFKRGLIIAALEKNSGNIKATARELGIFSSNLDRWLKELGLLDHARRLRYGVARRVGVQVLLYLVFAAVLLYPASALAQSECGTLENLGSLNAADSNGIVHQNVCWNPVTKVISFPLSSSGGTVSSVFGRSGAVVAVSTDYANVSNVTVGDGSDTLLVETGICSISLFDNGSDNIALTGCFGHPWLSTQGIQINAFTGPVTLNGATFGSSFATVVIGNNTTATPGIVVTDPTGTVWGTPTGGAKGAGSINAAGGLFINGVAVATGAVTSVFGRTGTVVAAANDYANVASLKLGSTTGTESLTFNVPGIVLQATDGIAICDAACVAGAGSNNIFIHATAALTLQGASITVFDAAGTVWGSPTGGSQGANTINAAGLFVNGVAVLTSSSVSSVFGRTGVVVATTGDYTVAQVTGAAPLASPGLTGTPTAPTPATADNSTKIATTAYVQAQGYVTASTAPVTSVFGRTGAVTATSGDYSVSQVTGAAPLASPTFTGTVTGPDAGTWISTGMVLGPGSFLKIQGLTSGSVELIPTPTSTLLSLASPAVMSVAAGFTTGTNYTLTSNGTLVLAGLATNDLDIEPNSVDTYRLSGANFHTLNGVLISWGTSMTVTDLALSRSAANVLAVGTSNTSGNTTGKIKASAYMSVGTTFTSNNGCSETVLTGGATAGSFKSGVTGTCTLTITTGDTDVAPNGWACRASDLTTPADTVAQTITTTNTFTFSGTTVSGDTINFACVGY